MSNARRVPGWIVILIAIVLISAAAVVIVLGPRRG
jgi:hypothetical protein